MRACIEHHTDECGGVVEFRESLTGTGTPIPRCDNHWDKRLAWQERHDQRYPDTDTPPSWFDPAYAGETWNEEQ